MRVSLALCVVLISAWASGQEPLQTVTVPPVLQWLPLSSPPPTDVFRDALVPKSWILEQHLGAQATISNVDNSLVVKVTQAGKSQWHIQMYMVPAALKAPGRYTIEFSMRADEKRKIPFGVSQHVAPYRHYLGTLIEFGPEWQDYKVSFTLSELIPGKTRVPVFQIGDRTGAIWIRSMKLVGPEPAPAPATAP